MLIWHKVYYIKSYPIPGSQVIATTPPLGTADEGTEPIVGQSQPLTPPGTDYLIVSDNPKDLVQVANDAVLWRASFGHADPLPALGPIHVRLFLYHGTTSLFTPRNVSVVLQNRFLFSSLRVSGHRTRSGIGRMSTPLSLGQQVALDYLSGQMYTLLWNALPYLTILSQSNGIIDTISIGPGLLAHYIYDLTISNAQAQQPSLRFTSGVYGNLSIITHRSQSPSSNQFVNAPIVPLSGSQPRGIYQHAEILRTATFGAKLRPQEERRGLIFISAGGTDPHGNAHDPWLQPVPLTGSTENKGNYGAIYRIRITFNNLANRNVTVRVYLCNQRRGPYAGVVNTPALRRPERTVLLTEQSPTQHRVLADRLDTVRLTRGQANVQREYLLMHSGGSALPIGLFFYTFSR
jgi:hypothetical protein